MVHFISPDMLLNDFSLNFQVRPTLFLNISRFKSDIQKVVPILIREVIRPFEMEENFLKFVWNKNTLLLTSFSCYFVVYNKILLTFF